MQLTQMEGSAHETGESWTPLARLKTAHALGAQMEMIRDESYTLTGWKLSDDSWTRPVKIAQNYTRGLRLGRTQFQLMLRSADHLLCGPTVPYSECWRVHKEQGCGAVCVWHKGHVSVIGGRASLT